MDYIDISEYFHNTDKLHQLITENPDLPLVVIAGQNACDPGYDSLFCSRVSAYIGEVLDCEQDFDRGKIFCDRDDFYDYVFDYYYDYCEGHFETSKEWDKYVDAKVAEFDSYWKKCIILCVDN